MTPKQITFAGRGSWMSVEVSSASPFNADSSRLLIQHSGGLFGLYDGDGKFLREMADLTHSQEPRWDRSNPSQLYYVWENSLRIYVDVDRGLINSIHTFHEYEFISGHGESDISQDGDHFVLAGQKADGSTEVFVFSLKDGKGPVFTQERPFDGLKLAANNHALVSNDSGILDLYVSRQLTESNGHAAVGVRDGAPVLIYCNSDEEVSPEGWANAAVMVDVETAKQTLLKPFPWALAFHVSTCELPFCLVSCYAPGGKLPNQLWKLPFDGSEPTMLHEWQSPYHKDHQPRASLSRDGSRCVYSVVGGTGDGICNVWMMKFDEGVPATLPTDGTRVDYSSFVGKKEWILRPREDGALDVIERVL